MRPFGSTNRIPERTAGGRTHLRITRGARNARIGLTTKFSDRSFGTKYQQCAGEEQSVPRRTPGAPLGALESRVTWTGRSEHPMLAGFLREHGQHTMLYLADAIQLFAAAMIGLATLEATARSLVVFFCRRSIETATDDVRLRLGRWLVLALEFQVAADILRTGVAPTWNEIGQLAAIIVLRTALNFFLQREQRDIERAAQNQRGNAPKS